MKKYNGFTLVEIIVCLVLISLISTISVIIFSNIKSKEYSNITKKIIQAASIYISNEKDEEGNTYEYGILHGAKGTQISVKTLVEEGYVDENTLKTLENEYKTKDNKPYLIQITNSIKKQNDEECKTNGLNYNVNWENTTNTVYLCPYDETQSTISDDFYNLKKCPNDDNSINKFCYYKDYDKYYYVGKVDNNYVRFGKNNNLWRILYIDTVNNEVKLVSNDRYKQQDYINKDYIQLINDNVKVGITTKQCNILKNGVCNVKHQDSLYDSTSVNQLRANSDCVYLYDESQNKISVSCSGCHNDTNISTRWYHYTNIIDEGNKKCEEAIASIKNNRNNYNSKECKSDKVLYNEENINVECETFTYYYNKNIIQKSASFTFYNPLYLYFYAPMNKIMDVILDEKQKELLKEHDYTINEKNNYRLTSKFGIPTLSEYSKISTAYYYEGSSYSDNNPYAYYYGDENSIMYNSGNKKYTDELVMNFVNESGNIQISTLYYNGDAGSARQIYLRPVVVLDLKKLNFNTGNGTYDSPYEIAINN